MVPIEAISAIPYSWLNIGPNRETNSLSLLGDIGDDPYPRVTRVDKLLSSLFSVVSPGGA